MILIREVVRDDCKGERCVCVSVHVCGGPVMNIAFYYFSVLFDSLPRSERCNLILGILCVPSSPAIIFELLTLKS